MSNELYTFAEPVQVVPFSSLKWGKFTLLHTPDGSQIQYLGVIENTQLLLRVFVSQLLLSSSYMVGTVGLSMSLQWLYSVLLLVY